MTIFPFILHFDIWMRQVFRQCH